MSKGVFSVAIDAEVLVGEDITNGYGVGGRTLEVLALAGSTGDLYSPK
jgi:hypothetical protein